MSSKLNYLQQKKLNPADELRALLTSLEDRQPNNFKTLNPTQALIFLRELDEVQTLLEQLQATDLNLTAEAGRFQAVQTHLKKHADKFLKALGGSAALSDYRPRPAPERKRWWWYIHEDVAAKQQQLLRRFVIGIVAVLAVIGLVVLAFNTILAPSPEAVARVDAENGALAAFEQQDYELAIASLNDGLRVVPNDPGLLVIKGVFLELSGKTDQARQSFEQARANIESESLFYLGRGQMYYRTAQYEKAEADAQTAIKVDQNMSSAWLLLGQVLESQGREFESISAYQKAGELALENGDSQVYVMARLAMSRVGGVFGP